MRRGVMAVVLLTVCWSVLLGQGWPPRNGATLPATCAAGEGFFLSTTTSTKYYVCTSTDVWIGPASSELTCNATTEKLRWTGSTWACVTDQTGGGGAPTGATYLTQTADGTLTAEQAMGALGTGLVLNTTTTGVQSIYGGTTCTGQFPRSLNASGVATCDTITDTDVPNTVTIDLATAATALATNPADCAANQFATTIAASGALTCAALADADVPNTITLDTLTQVTTRAISDTTGTLAVARGGTNLTAAADDNILVGNATTWETKAIPSCSGATTDKLLYTISTNTFSCGVDQGGGAGAGLTRINGSSGAAGADLTWQKLSANCTANATTTLAVCMTTTGVGAGTWSFKYLIFYQAAVTTTGVDFAVNHTGTVTKFVASSHFNTSGGAAATALGDQVSSNTATLTEGKSARAVNTKFGSSLGVDTINADLLVVIEGVIVVSATGSLELQHASELAASTQVMAETVLELHKIG